MTFNPHVLWCDHRDIEEHLHGEDMACCYAGVGKDLPVVPGLGYKKAQMWVYATRVAHPAALHSDVIPGRSAFDGIQLLIERHTGTEWDQDELQLTSADARSLAAALIRAADIEQGLTR